MKQPPSREQARQWLTVQVEALQELRSSHFRDDAFREWRQTTLDICEMVWPNDSTKTKRFRRIPFQSGSAKDSEKAVRNTFEKGCAEARRLLTLWLAEINLHGMIKRDRDASRGQDLMDDETLASIEMEPEVQHGDELEIRSDDDLKDSRFSMAKVSPSGERPRPKLPPELMPENDEDSALDNDDEGARKQKSGKKPKQRLRDMLQLDGVVRGQEDLTPGSKEPETEPEPEPEIQTMQGRASLDDLPAEFQIERMERTAGRGKGPDALEQMIGRMINAAMERALSDDRPRGHTAEARSAPSDADTVRDLPNEKPAAAQPPPRVPAMPPPVRAKPSSSQVESSAPPRAAAPGSSRSQIMPIPKGAAPAKRAEPHAASEPPPAESRLSRESEEISSAVRERLAVPIQVNPEDASNAVDVIMVLCVDLGSRMIPEDERRWVRSSLIDVAYRLDTGTLTWGSVAEAIKRAVGHPALARDLLPLLMPYLDSAA